MQKECNYTTVVSKLECDHATTVRVVSTYSQYQARSPLRRRTVRLTLDSLLSSLRTRITRSVCVVGPTYLLCTGTMYLHCLCTILPYVLRTS
jgi:hypothetical protein